MSTEVVVVVFFEMWKKARCVRRGRKKEKRKGKENRFTLSAVTMTILATRSDGGEEER